MLSVIGAPLSLRLPFGMGGRRRKGGRGDEHEDDDDDDEEMGPLKTYTLEGGGGAILRGL